MAYFFGITVPPNDSWIGWRPSEEEELLGLVSSLDGEERRKVLDFFTRVVKNKGKRSPNLYKPSWSNFGFMELEKSKNERERKQELLDVFRRLVVNKDTEAADRFSDLATEREKMKLKDYLWKLKCERVLKCKQEELTPEVKLMDYIESLKVKRHREELLDFVKCLVKNNEDHDKALDVFICLLFQEVNIKTTHEFTRLITEKEMLLLVDYVRCGTDKMIMMEEKKERKMLLMLLKAICPHGMSNGLNVLVITLQEFVGMHHGPGPPLDSVTRIQGSKYWMMECDVRADLLITCRWSNPTDKCDRCDKYTVTYTVSCQYTGMHDVCSLCILAKLKENPEQHLCSECGQEVITLLPFKMIGKRARSTEDEEVPVPKRTCSENVSTLSSSEKMAYSDPSIEDLLQKSGLTNADIDQPCSDEHILDIYPNLESWERVSAHLGLNRAEIAAIKQDAAHDAKLMRLYALQKWKSCGILKGTDTYRELLKALLKCEYNELALQVCDLLKEI